MNKIKLANFFRNTARYVLLIFGILIFLFALVSGAESFTIKEILKNSPNSFPWICFLLAVLIAWKNELLGGIILILLGFSGAFFFSIWNNLYEFIFFLVLGIIIFGSFFIFSWWLRRR